MLSWRAALQKRYRARRDQDLFKAYVDGDSSVSFPLPANAYLAVRHSSGYAGGEALKVNSDTLYSPELQPDEVYQLGWFEKDRVVQTLNGLELLFKKGFEWVSIGALQPVPPVPGPLDFTTDDVGLTSLTREFELALPQAAVGMGFFYTGTPIFTIAHGGEVLQTYARLNGASGIEDVGIGALVAVGRNLTVETANLVISCTGGTFGGVVGRINEIAYDFEDNWNDSAGGTSSSSPRLSGGSGELFAVGITAAYMTTPAYMTPLPRTAWGRIKDADDNDATVSLGRGKQSQVQLLNSGWRAYALQAVSVKERTE